MKHDEFIGHVQHGARLASRGAAERATRAALETLRERVPDGLADNLAALGVVHTYPNGGRLGGRAWRAHVAYRGSPVA